MVSKPPRPAGISREQVDEFELVYSQLERFHTELVGMAKGKGNDALNTFKLTLLNNLLRRANVLLGAKYQAIEGFKEFDPGQLPSVSDALVVVSQYLGSLEKYRADYIVSEYSAWYWVIDGKQSEVRTAPPVKLGKR